MKRGLVEEEKSEENEPAEKRELNADALVVIEEVKKDVLVEEEKQSEEEVGLLASGQLPRTLSWRSKNHIPSTNTCNEWRNEKCNSASAHNYQNDVIIT